MEPTLTEVHLEPAPTSTEHEAWDRAIAHRICLHCGGDLGRAWREEDGPFCCRGCRSVYGIIHRSGLMRYYDLQQGRQSPPALLRPDNLAWLDQLLEKQPPASPANSSLLQLSLDIQGVHCAACVWLLEKLFRREDGGLDLRINPSLGKVDLTWDTAQGDLKHYLAEVEKFGYRFGPSRKDMPTRSRALLARMAVCIAIAMNVMMFSLSYYLGLAPADGALYTFFGRLSLALASVSVLVGGQVFFKGALAGLRQRVAHLDLPISLGITLAYAGSVYGYFTAGPEAAYFDSLTIFIALMLVGRWSQEHILERNRNALLAAGGAENITAKRQQQGRLQAVAAPDIRRGDELWIAPGDLVPLAGILLRKSATVSLDWITGESDHQAYEPGDTVPAGAFNAGRSGFVITAVENFADSRLQELLRSGPGAVGDDTPRPRWWSRISTAYVVAVLLLASAGFLAWAGRDPHQALEVAIAILVVTCPCALGLATPLATELTHSALRRRGVFLRKAGFMDRSLAVRKLLLDKTGTLTLGCLVLTPEARETLRRLEPADRATLWNLAARSNHPVSQALAKELGDIRGSTPENVTAPGNHPSAEDVTEYPGQGLVWRHAGRVYRLGRYDFSISTRAVDERGSGPHGSDGGTTRTTVFSVDGHPLATFCFTEDLKADAAEELAWLHAKGYEIHLLSGDSPAKVQAVATALGIPSDRAVGGLTPEDKAARVRQLDRRDSLMVGDGLNDSPSFAAAYCAATPAVDRPVLPGKADFYFLGDGISALRRALMSAIRLRRVVRDNLILAIFYNLIAVSLCFAGLVTPVVAAVLMPLSSVSVVALTAFRLSERRLAWMS